MSSVTLSVVAKASPAPYAALAIAYDLDSRPNSNIKVDFVHALPNAASAQLVVDGYARRLVLL